MFNYISFVSLLILLSLCAIWKLSLLRAIYAVDMFAGIVFAHYFWIISGWISPYIDRWGGYKDCRADYNKLQL